MSQYVHVSVVVGYDAEGVDKIQHFLHDIIGLLDERRISVVMIIVTLAG